MPAVELLLARQTTGKRTMKSGSLPVTFSTGATAFDAIAAAMTLANDVLTIPFIPCMFRVDNSDNAQGLLVACKSGASVTVDAGASQLLFCDGDNVVQLGSSSALVAPTITYTGTLAEALPLAVTAPIAAWYQGTTIAAPAGSYIEGGLYQETALTSIDLGNVAGVGWNGIGLPNNSVLTSFVARSLVITNGGIALGGCTALTSVDLSALRVCCMFPNQTGLDLSRCTSLTSLALPVLEYAGAPDIHGCTLLATLSIGASLKGVGGNASFAACALDQTSVDGVLARFAALDGTNGTIAYSGQTIDLSGGSNAVPSAAGLANAAILTGRGNTVTVNS